MNTKPEMAAAAAAITGARHLRVARNGQDATALWVGDGGAAVVVCDGCGSGASSEVGARLGASLAIHAIAGLLAKGEPPSTLWAAVRAHIAGALASVVEQMAGDRANAIRDHFLFTIVAAAITRHEAAVWMLGDGAYLLGGRTHVAGPFDGNQPPYLAYDLLGAATPAHLAVGPVGPVVVATDGGADLDLARFATRRFVDHPDALRRHLAVLARGTERLDWDERRVARTPAVLQDDCAIGVLLPGDA